MTLNDHLKNLQIDIKDFSHENLKKAYRLLSMKYHPDRGGSEIDFKRLRASYEYLEDNFDDILQLINEPVKPEPVYRSSFSKALIQTKPVYNTSKKPYVYPNAPKWQGASSLNEDPYVKHFERIDPDDEVIGERYGSNFQKKKKKEEEKQPDNKADFWKNYKI